MSYDLVHHIVDIDGYSKQLLPDAEYIARDWSLQSAPLLINIDSIPGKTKIRRDGKKSSSGFWLTIRDHPVFT